MSGGMRGNLLLNDINIIFLSFFIVLIFAFLFVFLILPSINWASVVAAKHPPYAEIMDTSDGVAIKWWSGWDSGFMGDMKIESNHGYIIVPLPEPGRMLYLNGSYNANDTVVFVMNDAVKSWICVGNCQ